MSTVAVVRPGGPNAPDKSLHSWGASATSHVAGSSHSLTYDLDTPASASRAGVETAVANCRLALLFAHGLPDSIENGSLSVLDLQNVSKANGVIVMAMSCDTSQILGPSSITSGVEAYLGFNEMVHWMDAGSTSVTSETRTGDAWNAGIGEILRGKSLRAAKRAIERAFDQMVADFSADLRAGGDPDNVFAYAWASWNRHHLQLDGNGGATL